MSSLELSPEAVETSLLKAQPTGWSREGYCQTVASLLFDYRSSVYEADGGAYYGTRVRTRGATKTDILFMPPADKPAHELDLVYGSNPFKNKVRYVYLPEGRTRAPKMSIATACRRTATS